MARRRHVWTIALLVALAALPVSPAAAKPPSTFNPVVEAQNFPITGTFDCEDMREGCPGMVANDGYPGDYSYVAIDRSPDAVRGGG
jgi:hypothetical protein